MSDAPQASPEPAYLLLQTPLMPGVETRIELSSPITCLGRPETHNTGPHAIDLKLENISRQHAQIVRQGQEYVLLNYRGKGKIRLYDRVLSQDERHALRHNDTFLIPDLDGPQVRLTFVIGNGTRFLPLTVAASRLSIHVFGEEVPVQPLEHSLLSYLYHRQAQLCRYDELIEWLWPSERREQLANPMGQLEVLLAKIRRKIRPLSGGFTYLETFPSEGVRLVF